MAWVRDQFDYEKARTNVHSSLDDILKSGGGVCQDFAHLTIGLLRLAGVPARYVSGYLAPAISPTGDVSVGEQASHAWLEAWLPHAGWPASTRPIDIALMNAMSGWPLDATMPTCRH